MQTKHFYYKDKAPMVKEPDDFRCGQVRRRDRRAKERMRSK